MMLFGPFGETYGAPSDQVPQCLTFCGWVVPGWLPQMSTPEEVEYMPPPLRGLHTSISKPGGLTTEPEDMGLEP